MKITAWVHITRTIGAAITPERIENMKCPRCGKEVNKLLALSRADNRTRATRAASIVNGQPMVGNIRSLDKTAEVIVEQICLGYDKENKYTLSNNSVQIPKYISDLRLEFEKLKQYGMISDYNVWTPDCWKIDILPCLLTYKDDKEKGIFEENKKQTKQISIGTINAANGNVVIGDVINSSNKL